MKNITSKVAFRANSLAKQYGKSMAFRIAWKVEKLIAQMKVGKAEFSFVKENGELRNATGTLETGYVSKYWNGSSKSAGTKADVVKFFDVTVNQWRSFRVDRMAA